MIAYPRDLDCWVASDTFEVVSTRIARLARQDRVVTIVREWADEPAADQRVDAKTGLRLEPEGFAGPVVVANDAGGGYVSVRLTRCEGYSVRSDDDRDEAHVARQPGKERTHVRILGGGSDDPRDQGVDDRIIIDHTNTYGVRQRTVVLFARDDRDPT